MTENLDKNPIDIHMGDLIRSVFMNACDAIAHAEPAIDHQLREPSAVELAEIENLARKAAELQDDLASNPDDRPEKLKALKAELLGKLLAHDMDGIKIHGRPAIEVIESNTRKATRKSLIETLQRIRGDKKKGREEAIVLWNSIAPTTSHRLVIPDAAPPEMESPY